MFTVEDSSAVLWFCFAHQGSFIHSPKPEKPLFSERDFLVQETAYAVFLHRIQLCATTGELESVANEIKVDCVEIVDLGGYHVLLFHTFSSLSSPSFARSFFCLLSTLFVFFSTLLFSLRICL